MSMAVGNLFVIAAPSGTGKTTLVKAVVDSLSRITVSISHTTRPKRPNEMHGINYYFVDDRAFDKMIAHHDFLEYAHIFDYRYGTSKKMVGETLAKGIDVILEIDWQGQQQIKRLFPHCISIFILPPSMEDLRERLVKRNQDHAEIIKERLVDVKETVSHIHEFDYMVVNDDFSQASQDLRLIIEASRLNQHRQTTQYTKLIENLSQN